jgi:pyrroloquinoline quinone biosynthesis protein D
VSIVSDTSRLVIAPGMRLQWEAAQDAHVLLYPEGMVKLNGSAGAIMSRCDGVRSVADVITDIEKSFGLSGIGADVHAFVALALERHWLELRE